MRLNSADAPRGYPQYVAECRSGQTIIPDPLFLISRAVVVTKAIQDLNGQLPDDVAAKIAENSCKFFDGGECELRRNNVCTL